MSAGPIISVTEYTVNFTMPNGLTFEVVADISEVDGVLCVFVDTPGLPENNEGPIMRLYLNEDAVHANPEFPT